MSSHRPIFERLRDTQTDLDQERKTMTQMRARAIEMSDSGKALGGDEL
jgi:hypothetical protein